MVFRVLEMHLKPMQAAMLAVAPQMKLAQEKSKDRVKLLPLLMKVGLSCRRIGAERLVAPSTSSNSCRVGELLAASTSPCRARR